MITLLVASLLLTGVQGSPDEGRIVLTFDGPAAFTQTVSMNPPRLILNVAGAAADPDALPEAEAGGLGITAMQDPAGLRIALPLQDGFKTTVSATVTAITIDLEPEPRLMTARAEEAPSSSEGGITLSASETAGTEGGYLIGPEDLLEINVFELPELKTTTRVLGNGTISLPLLGVLQAAGLSKTGLEARLRDLLEQRYLIDPQVTVTVTEFRSKQISVIGAVTKPGTYEMIGPRTVLQMLSEAGGLTKEAGTDIIILRRSDGDQSERILIDLEDLVIRGNPALNVALRPGDVINVPIDQPIFVYVDGAVAKPGQVEGTASRPITLLQAVSRAGGMTERANMKGVHILRKREDGTQVRIPVNLRDIRKGKADDIFLQDGDVVVVPETFF